MNQRIQELAYEAEDYADSIVDQGGEFHLAYTKKFAELIVRECAKAAVNEFDQVEDFSSNPAMDLQGAFNAGKVRASLLIQQHFGIEQ